MKTFDRNTLIYLFYSGTPAVFHRSIQYLFLRSLGVETSAIFSLWGAGYLLNAFLEFPIGLLSDHIPRKYVLALSSFLFLIAQTLYIFVSPATTLLLYLSEALSTLSTSLYTGTKSSILADHLRAESRFEDFPLIQSTALLMMRMMTLVFVGIGGALYAYYNRAPYFANIALLFLGAFAILSFREKALTKIEKAEPFFSPLAVDLKRVWVFVFYSAFLSSFFFFMGNLLQPYLETVHQFKIKDQILTYQLYTFAGVVGSFLVVPWLKKRKVNYQLMYFFAFTGVFFFALSLPLGPVLAISLFLFLRLIDGVQNIFFLNELHFYTERRTRATILSMKSIIESLFRALLHFSMGSSLAAVAAGGGEFQKTLVYLSLISLVFLLPAPFYFKRFYEKRVNLGT